MSRSPKSHSCKTSEIRIMLQRTSPVSQHIGWQQSLIAIVNHTSFSTPHPLRSFAFSSFHAIHTSGFVFISCSLGCVSVKAKRRIRLPFIIFITTPSPPPSPITHHPSSIIHHPSSIIHHHTVPYHSLARFLLSIFTFSLRVRVYSKHGAWG